jgi:hypothetical protein
MRFLWNFLLVVFVFLSPSAFAQQKSKEKKQAVVDPYRPYGDKTEYRILPKEDGSSSRSSMKDTTFLMNRWSVLSGGIFGSYGNRAVVSAPFMLSQETVLKGRVAASERAWGGGFFVDTSLPSDVGYHSVRLRLGILKASVSPTSDVLATYIENQIEKKLTILNVGAAYKLALSVDPDWGVFWGGGGIFVNSVVSTQANSNTVATRLDGSKAFLPCLSIGLDTPVGPALDFGSQVDWHPLMGFEASLLMRLPL